MAKAAHQRLANLGRVGTGLGGQQQRLAHRLDGQRDDDLDLATLVIWLSPLPPTRVMFLPISSNGGLTAPKAALAAADHDGGAGGLGADLATETGASRYSQPSALMRSAKVVDRRDRTHVDHDLALASASAATPFSLNSTAFHVGCPAPW